MKAKTQSLTKIMLNNKIKSPRKTAGAANQKPLTIKPYPMKIRNEYNSKQRFRLLF